MQTYNIIVFTETWSSELSHMNMDDYKYFAVHRPRSAGAKRDSGGVAIYYENHLDNVIEFIKSSNYDLLWIKINDNILLSAVYNIAA